MPLPPFLRPNINQTNNVPIRFPNSAAERNRFLANLTGVGTENFSQFRAGTYTQLPLTFSGASSATLRNADGSRNLRIRNQEDEGLDLFATSPENYLNTLAGGAGRFVVDFASPVAAFGFYGVDIGDQGAVLRVDFFNGRQLVATQNLPRLRSGSVLFFGLIAADQTETFNRVEFNSNFTRTDNFAFDDLTVGALD